MILAEALTMSLSGVRASATTSRGPVTGPTTTNVLANLKNWKLDLEKLESHLEQNWSACTSISLTTDKTLSFSMFSFFDFLLKS